MFVIQTQRLLDHVWWEDIKGVSASAREEIWSKPFSFIATFKIILSFPMFIRNNLHTTMKRPEKKKFSFSQGWKFIFSWQSLRWKMNNTTFWQQLTGQIQQTSTFHCGKQKTCNFCDQGFAQQTDKEISGEQKGTKTSCMLLEQQMVYLIYIFQSRRMLSEIFTSYMKIYGVSFKFREPICVSQHKEINFVCSWMWASLCIFFRKQMYRKTLI